MEKVKLTSKQATGLEHAVKLHKKGYNYDGKTSIISLHASGEEWGNECEPLNDLSLNTLIIALYIGYEVEQTEQEKIQELWNRPDSTSAFRFIIELTLKALGREDLIPKPEEEN
jgi:hypothetical protein